MNCKLPILTDSGGFQIMSLSKFVKIDKKIGAIFNSHIDGKKFSLSPEADKVSSFIKYLPSSKAFFFSGSASSCSSLNESNLFSQVNHRMSQKMKEKDSQMKSTLLKNEKDLNSVQGRICDAKEVASAVLYLASDESSFVNGNAFYVDNGWYSKG